MPIIKCPGCDKRVDDKESTCPMCGYRLVRYSKNSRLILNIILMILICVSAFIAVVAFTLGNTVTGSAAAVFVIICLIRLFVR